MSCLRWPLAEDDVRDLKERLLEHCRDPSNDGVPYLSNKELRFLISRATEAMNNEENIVCVPSNEDTDVVVVGDIHGQFFDLCTVLDAIWDRSKVVDGDGSGRRRCTTAVFAGDFVDRGCWGVEVLTLLMAMRMCDDLPFRVVLLRGNHEAESVVDFYGFASEVRAKHGDSLFDPFMRLFTALPIAAVISTLSPNAGPGVLVVHGGLWRAMGSDPPTVGSMDDLRRCDRSRLRDVWGCDAVADALWSDPISTDTGVVLNAFRNVGLEFGRSATLAFLKANNLAAIIRAHEGPDARDKRGTMPSMDGGSNIDQKHDDGRPACLTVFSAPDYPQFKPPDWPTTRGSTMGAYTVVHLPAMAIETIQFSSVPHPPGTKYQAIERF